MSGIRIPFRDLLNPETGSGHVTVPGKMISVNFGTINVVGQDEIEYFVPAIQGFKIEDQPSVPIENVGTYVSNVLAPNTFYKTLKFLTRGFFQSLGKIIFNDSKAFNNYTSEVTDPAWESFTKDVFFSGAGITPEQLGEYTGFTPKAKGKPSAGSIGGGHYKTVKVGDLGETEGVQFGRALGYKGYKGRTVSATIGEVNEIVKETFGKDYRTVTGNAGFMRGVYNGIREGAKQPGKYGKTDEMLSNVPRYCTADGYDMEYDLKSAVA